MYAISLSDTDQDRRIQFMDLHRKELKNNAGVAMNNDLEVTREAICQLFSRVTKSRVKIICKSPHELPNNRYSR